MSKTNDLIHINSATVPLSATTAGANVALPRLGTGVVVTNLGQYPAWCCTGIGVATAALASTGNGCCVAPGTAQAFQIDRQHTYFASITTGGTSLLSISVSQGGT